MLLLYSFFIIFLAIIYGTIIHCAKLYQLKNPSHFKNIGILIIQAFCVGGLFGLCVKHLPDNAVLLIILFVISYLLTFIWLTFKSFK